MISKARTIQCSDNGDDFTVDVLFEDDSLEADSHFSGKGRRVKAERRAEVLAKLHGCDWVTNY
jgi:hypothetical protein